MALQRKRAFLKWWAHRWILYIFYISLPYRVKARNVQVVGSGNVGKLSTQNVLGCSCAKLVRVRNATDSEVVDLASIKRVQTAEAKRNENPRLM